MNCISGRWSSITKLYKKSRKKPSGKAKKKKRKRRYYDNIITIGGESTVPYLIQWHRDTIVLTEDLSFRLRRSDLGSGRVKKWVSRKKQGMGISWNPRKRSKDYQTSNTSPCTQGGLPGDSL